MSINSAQTGYAGLDHEDKESVLDQLFHSFAKSFVVDAPEQVDVACAHGSVGSPQAEAGAKRDVTFESLSPELRNRIYHFSGCLRLHEWRNPGSKMRIVVSGESEDHDELSWSSWSPVHIAWRTPKTWSSAYLVVGGKSDRVCTPTVALADQARRPTEIMMLDYDISVYVTQIDSNLLVQPPLTRVSKMVRDETLSIFYGSHPFVFQLDDKSNHPAAKLLAYLHKIGPRNAKRIRELYIVYKMRNRAKRYVEDKLVPVLRRCGIDIDADVVKPVRMPPPYRDDEHSILNLLHEMRAE